jgi:hypothetical protein
MNHKTRRRVTIALTMMFSAAGCAQQTFHIESAEGTISLDPATARAVVATRLAQLGAAPSFADQRAALLTDADVLVLASNPAMMQCAGWESSDTIILIIAIAIIVVLVVLAADGSGLVIFSS